MGSADLKLGRLHQAEVVLRRATADDPRLVPALNNLGVVLMERGRFGEAHAIFQRAFKLDSGQSEAIRDNLKLTSYHSEKAVHDAPQTPEAPRFNLMRRGAGDFVLLSQL